MGFFLDLWWWLGDGGLCFSGGGGFLVMLGCEFGFYGGGGVLWGVVATTLEREREREREREKFFNVSYTKIFKRADVSALR